MRVPLLVYGVLYVVVETIGHQLEQIGWRDVSALDVASAVTDALLVVAICAAGLLTLDLGARRWRRSMAGRHREHAGAQGGVRYEPDVGTRRRPEPLTVTAERVEEPPKRRYRGNPYSFAGHRFPEDPGRLL